MSEDSTIGDRSNNVRVKAGITVEPGIGMKLGMRPKTAMDTNRKMVATIQKVLRFRATFNEIPSGRFSFLIWLSLGDSFKRSQTSGEPMTTIKKVRKE